MPRNPQKHKDIDRGKRFAEVSENLFGDISRSKIADLIGVSSEGRVRAFISGDPIENRALARLLELGADVGYILTGKREAPQATKPGAPDMAVPALKPAPENCPNHAICELVSTLLPLLGGTLAASLSSPDARERIGHALHEVQRVLSDLESGGSDKAAG